MNDAAPQIDFKKIIPPFIFGYTGRHLFGGLGGALLGASVYIVFIKPTIFPTKSGQPLPNGSETPL
jgi:hypothetical protein